MTRTRTIFVFVVLLLVAWGLLTIRIGAPWLGHQDANGAWISAAIRNYERYGFGALGGMIVLNNSPLQPNQSDQYVYYANHPPLPVWLPSLPVLLVGYDEVVVRFVFAACTLLSIAALYRLVRRLFGHTQALWSAAFYGFTPMIAYFGRMPDHEAPAILLLLLFTWVIVLWLQQPTRERWLALAALIFMQAWTAWGGLISIFAVCVAALWTAQRPQRRAVLVVMLVGILGAGAVFAFYQLLWSGTLDSFVDKFLWRSSSQSFVPGSEPFTWGQYGGRLLLRFITLFTPTICVVAALGVAPLFRDPSRLRRAVPLALLLGGVGFALLFRNASYVHDYYLMYVTPAVAIFSAVGLGYWWQQRRTMRWMRPLLVGLLVATPIAVIRYIDQLYQGSDQTDPLIIAQAFQQQTAANDLIMSNLPMIGLAIDFYASRDIDWEVTPAEAAARRDERESVYYFRCGESGELPAGTPVLSEVEVVPQCWLTRLS